MEKMKSIQAIFRIETGLRMIDRQEGEGTIGTIIEILFPKFEEVPQLSGFYETNSYLTL